MYLLIKAGTARVPLWAGWERGLCKGEVPFRRRFLSLMLQVFYGIGRKGKMITFENNQIGLSLDIFKKI